jgi:hypothetical protein
MFNHCGLTLTIDQIDDILGVYRMKEDPWHLYNDDMISHLYEEKDSPRFAVGDKVILDHWPCEVINVRYIKEKSRFLYTVKGIDFTKLVSADMLEIDASEYPKYNVGDVVGVYGYETDVVIADVRKEGSSFVYKVYLADEEEWIDDSDIAYRGDIAKAVSSMKSNTPEVKREPLFKPDDKVETNDNLFGTVDRSWWDEKENCYMYEVSFGHVDFGIYKEKHLKPYVKKTNKPDACRSCFTPFLSTQCLIKDCPHNKQIKAIMNISDKATDIITSQLMEGKRFNLPDGYHFVDENGNKIEALKIALEKDVKKYPNTYEECCEVLGKYADVTYGYKNYVLHTLQMLLVCRDAYWEIAGQEMGLDDPWEPDWEDDHQNKYTIYTMGNKVIRHVGGCIHSILAFPTEKMRETFYENFKEEIEKCKELL